MDIKNTKEKEVDEVMDWNEIFCQDNEEDIYCAKCLQIPKYTIVVTKNKDIQLTHICKETDETINFPFEKKSHSFPASKCYYCQNATSDVCLECKNYICKRCQNEHVSKTNDENIITWNLVGSKDKKEETNYICLDKKMQFFCDEHFMQYRYFCPYCEKNLCTHCKNFHVHINCQSLFDNIQTKNEKILSKNSSDKFIINLNKLSELFEKSYQRNYGQNQMCLNILENYSLIKGINELIQNYKKNEQLKKNKKISSNFLNNQQKEEENICDYFYDDKFKNIYSDLIKQTNRGNYEYHHKLKVLEQFYKNKNKYNVSFNFDEDNFINSLKGQIYNFKYIFISLKDKLSKLNMKIRINYLNKEISQLKLLINTLEVDIHLLKQINMNLLLKYNYQLRRKTGNLISEVILKNYAEQLEIIKENNYILMESIIQIRKKIAESNELEGPEIELLDYKNKLETKYEQLLKLTNEEILSQLKKLKEKQFELGSLDDDVDIRIKPKNNDDWEEVIVLNLFFIIKQKYGKIFNDTIHNHTEIVNMQLIDEIKKINGVSLSGNEQVKVNGNHINGSEINVKVVDKKNKKCQNHYEIFNELKNYFGIHKNCLSEERKNILELITYADNSETNIDDYKSKLDNMFKNYEFEDSINLNDASQLFFNGEIIDILSEKKVYQNINKIINEMKQVDLEKIKNEILVDIEKIEPELNKIIKESEMHKFLLFNKIKKVKKYISMENKDKKEELNNPFEILEKLENYDLDYISDDNVKNIYMIYLVNLYFCAEQACEYFNILKEKYSDFKLMDLQKRNIEKNKLIKAFDSMINYDEPDTFTKIWNQLKKEDILDKSNNTLNTKIKEYIKNNNEKTFLKDLSDITKLKDKKIELWKSDPQYIAVKAYWYLKDIPLEIPSTLKMKQI